MTEIDRRTMLRGVFCGVAVLTTGGGVAVATMKPAEAIPLALDKLGPIETDDLFEDQEQVEHVHWYHRRRRRRRRRWICWRRRGRLICVRRRRRFYY